MACLVDVGDLQALAFTDKQEAGRRLALLALAKTYGQAGVACSGPTPADLQIKDGKAYIRFKDADGVLIVHGKELAGFSIAGADGVYAPALTRLEGEAIVVWNDQVANPVKVRYGGADYAGKLNLTSAAGLPTPPFTISTSGN
jgi:sialate O-acetylesterase